MRVRSHHIAVSLSVGALLVSILGSLVVSLADSSTALATCGTGASVVITSPTNTSGGQPLNGVRGLTAYSTPTVASGMTFMLIAPNQTPIGEAVQNGSTWKLDWDTRNVPNGGYQLIAVAHFGSATTLDCASPALPIYIQNNPTQAPQLTATITPNNWDTTIGTSRTFSIDALYTDQYGRQSHVGPATSNSFVWHTSIGSLTTTQGATTVLTASPTTGTGVLGATVAYAGLNATATAPIKVSATSSGSGSTSGNTSASPEPNSSPATGSTTSAPGSDTTSDDTTRLATMPTIFRPVKPTNSDPVVALSTLSCLEKKVGFTRFQEISSGKSQPTAAERKTAAGCFSGPEPIPAVLAPVAPAHINEIEQTEDLIKVAEIKNTIVTNKEGKKITGLLVSGQGAPNTNVFVYVFSDPLVLRAQTDAKGNWSYVLETPLKPGHHEVYAVAEKDAGTFVRSSAVPISIAAAAPGSQDGSLVIERRLSPAQIGFIAGAVLAVLAAIGVLFGLLRRRRKLGGRTSGDGSPATPAGPPATTSAVPGQTFHPTAPVAEPPSANGPQA
jgi:hypothetical protein